MSRLKPELSPFFQPAFPPSKGLARVPDVSGKKPDGWPAGKSRNAPYPGEHESSHDVEHCATISFSLKSALAYRKVNALESPRIQSQRRISRPAGGKGKRRRPRGAGRTPARFFQANRPKKLDRLPLLRLHTKGPASGGVAERLNAAVLKTVDAVRRPGVQIPPPPPDNAPRKNTQGHDSMKQESWPFRLHENELKLRCGTSETSAGYRHPKQPA